MIGFRVFEETPRGAEVLADVSAAELPAVGHLLTLPHGFDGKVMQVEWVHEKHGDFSITLHPTVTVRRY